MNLLIQLYESGVISEEHANEFKRWHHKIAFCGVCGDKLMHGDEAYTDEITNLPLCDKHSIFNEETDMHHSPNAFEITVEIEKERKMLKNARTISFDKGIDLHNRRLANLTNFLHRIKV